MRSRLFLLTLSLMCLPAASAPVAHANLTGAYNFVVLRVTFSDFGTTTRFTTAQTQANFNSIAQLWGTDTSYGNITLQYQFAGPTQVAKQSASYLDIESGQSSSTAAILALIKDAVATAPTTINWANVYGLVVLFADTRAGGFYRGITLPSTVSVSPPSAGPSPPPAFNVHASIVGENPAESVARTWGRWAHEMGHQMQVNPGNPWHPSNYNSNFDEMDNEYPGQSGVFFKQANMAFPGWMPPGKYKTISPPTGAAVALLAEEQAPSLQPDFQAIKAFLTFGGQQVYYLVSVRRRVLGDDTATTQVPNGIPDEGVLIERVVEGGNPALDDCTTPATCLRWVEVRGNGNSDKLWHVGETYSNTTDGIFITVRASPDVDHYVVNVAYKSKAGQPDVGINSWLEPPSNSYESTDIWVDSPVNGYGTYRYGSWSDLAGGTVPKGNGDDPAVGLVNRVYARVRNYGSKPAVNVVVRFDVTNPLGVGINGSNGFAALGTVSSAQFPGLAMIPAGSFVDVYSDWTPNVALTPAQIQAGHFAFHSCLRVRIDHVASETFFANQDGDGQQENIDYFDAGSASTPGAPGAASTDVIHLRNDSPSRSKEFFLSVQRESMPSTWRVTVNNGNPVVTLGPGQVRDVPVVIKQTVPEAIGSRHSVRIFASSRVMLTPPKNPGDKHDSFVALGGVRFEVAVLRKPKLQCRSLGAGRVTGRLTGVGTEKGSLRVYVVGIGANGRLLPRQAALATLSGTGGTFTVVMRRPLPKRAVCLFAGTTRSASAGTAAFPM